MKIILKNYLKNKNESISFNYINMFSTNYKYYVLKDSPLSDNFFEN